LTTGLGVWSLLDPEAIDPVLSGPEGLGVSPKLGFTGREISVLDGAAGSSGAPGGPSELELGTEASRDASGAPSGPELSTILSLLSTKGFANDPVFIALSAAAAFLSSTSLLSSSASSYALDFGIS